MNSLANPNVVAKLGDPLKNHLLAALPADELARVLPKLEPVTLKLGAVLYESGDKLDYVYYPTTAIISLLYIMENGATAVCAVFGRTRRKRINRRVENFNESNGNVFADARHLVEKFYERSRFSQTAKFYLIGKDCFKFIGLFQNFVESDFKRL